MTTETSLIAPHHKPLRPHRCLMVYPSGVREEIPRMTSQIRIWILSNKTFHPTAALFVDGKCRYQGRIPDEKIATIEGEINDHSSI